MARARTMPRHTADPEAQTPPEAAEGADQGTRAGGQHSFRGRQSQHKNRQSAEHHSRFEDRSMLDALWGAMVAAPTSVVPTLPTDAPEPAPAPAVGVAPAPTVTMPPAVPGAVLSAPVVSAPVPPTPDPAPPAAAAPAGPVLTAGEPAGTPRAASAIGPILGVATPSAGARAEAPTAAVPPPGMTPDSPDAADAEPSVLSLLGWGRAPGATNRTIWAGPRHAAPHDWNSTSTVLTIETPASVADAGLLVMRLVIGLTMAAHGAQKAFGAFGGPGLHGTADMFASLGYQPGMLFALAAVAGELCGGLLLTVGLLTPLAAGGIIGVTVNAMVAVNFSNGFFATNNGIELPLVLSGGALALLLAGPGRYAADARIPFFNGLAVQCAAASVAMFALLTSLAAHLL